MTFLNFVVATTVLVLFQFSIFEPYLNLEDLKLCIDKRAILQSFTQIKNKLKDREG